MSHARLAAADLQSRLGSVKHGTLRVFGDWFGRPLDNIQVPVAAEAVDDELIVTFNEDERLIITAPRDWAFTSEVFTVLHADRVIWRWFSYGRPKTPENLFTTEHWTEADGSVGARSNVDRYTRTFAPSLDFAAAELL